MKRLKIILISCVLILVVACNSNPRVVETSSSLYVQVNNYTNVKLKCVTTLDVGTCEIFSHGNDTTFGAIGKKGRKTLTDSPLPVGGIWDRFIVQSQTIYNIDDSTSYTYPLDEIDTMLVEEVGGNKEEWSLKLDITDSIIQLMR